MTKAGRVPVDTRRSLHVGRKLKRSVANAELLIAFRHAFDLFGSLQLD